MSLAGSQRQTYLQLVRQLRPHWRQDLRFPERLQKTLAAQKRFGSRDRKLYRELLYTTLRFLPWIEPGLDRDPERTAATVAWLAADTPATRGYRAELKAGLPPCPETLEAKARILQEEPRRLLPEWIASECPAALQPAELDALNRRAPLWLRLQTDVRTEVTAEFDQRGWLWRPCAITADAIEIVGEVDVTRCEAYQRGQVEVQDLGSQLVLVSAGIQPGGHWLDACAGAGGKTLQLARLLGPDGQVTAHDIRRTALDELRLRAARAGLRQVRLAPQLPGDEFDGVLVDAPCSGSGTWRRSPHLKWTTTAAGIAEQAARQLDLLQRFAARVRPGGTLLYATCSLNRTENEAVVEAFLARQSGFVPAPPAESFGFAPGPSGLAIHPARHDTDGFFVARLSRS